MKRFIDNTTIWCIAAVFPKDLWLMLALLLKKTLSFSSNHCRSVLERAGHSASCSFTRGWAAKLSLCPPGRCFLTVSGSCRCCLLFSVAAGPGVASFTSGMGKILGKKLLCDILIYQYIVHPCPKYKLWQWLNLHPDGSHVEGSSLTIYRDLNIMETFWCAFLALNQQEHPDNHIAKQ